MLGNDEKYGEHLRELSLRCYGMAKENDWIFPHLYVSGDLTKYFRKIENKIEEKEYVIAEDTLRILVQIMYDFAEVDDSPAMSEIIGISSKL